MTVQPSVPTSKIWSASPTWTDRGSRSHCTTIERRIHSTCRRSRRFFDLPGRWAESCKQITDRMARAGLPNQVGIPAYTGHHKPIDVLRWVAIFCNERERDHIDVIRLTSLRNEVCLWLASLTEICIWDRCRRGSLRTVLPHESGRKRWKESREMAIARKAALLKRAIWQNPNGSLETKMRTIFKRHGQASRFPRVPSNK